MKKEQQEKEEEQRQKLMVQVMKQVEKKFKIKNKNKKSVNKYDIDKVMEKLAPKVRGILEASNGRPTKISMKELIMSLEG